MRKFNSLNRILKLCLHDNARNILTHYRMLNCGVIVIRDRSEYVIDVYGDTLIDKTLEDAVKYWGKHYDVVGYYEEI